VRIALGRVIWPRSDTVVFILSEYVFILLLSRPVSARWHRVPGAAGAARG